MSMSVVKKIYDSVHGFIHFSELESALIDSQPFQRLHYLHQLGIAYLVYPGATHTRFEHSIGVMELATRIFDQIISKYKPKDTEEDPEYWRQIIRFAALCHDLGHLPFSHVAEKAILGEAGHEKWSLEIIRSRFLEPIWEELSRMYPNRQVAADIIKLSLGEDKLAEMGGPVFSPWEKVMCQIISGDFFGADRIDYLIRDAQCTGVSYGLFDYHQMIEMLCILPSLDGSGNLELGIDENGIEACEALLLARHFMHKRVYQYSSVKAYSFHLKRFMELLYQNKEILYHLDKYLSMTDCEVISAIRLAATDQSRPGHQDAVCLSKRGRRFEAIQVSEHFMESDLDILRESLQISENAIGLERGKKAPTQTGLSFLTLSRGGTVCTAHECSEIVIPSLSRNWIYVDSSRASDVAQALEQKA